MVSIPLTRVAIESGVLDRDTCPECGGPLENLTETAVDVDQFRREDGRCFLFYSKDRPLLECRTGGPWHDPR
jgi:uncharacterized protein with PIN domain